MQVVNIRQLKNNPSQALRAAHEDDMVVVMNRDTPTALLVDLEKLGLYELHESGYHLSDAVIQAVLEDVGE